VVEEGGPFVEQSVRALAQRARLPAEILGKQDGSLPAEGELAEADLARALAGLDGAIRPELGDAGDAVDRAMPSRVPLCDDCPYRPAFEALLRAMERHGGRQSHIVIGETGCMVRANLPPMELFDVKYSLGSGLGLGMGLAASDSEHRVVALVGDSSFFHTGINAMPLAAQLDLPMLVVVLDNGTTALTGGQAHPGSSTDERGQRRRGADLAELIRACGVEPLECTPDDVPAMEATLGEALAADGMRVVILRGPCPRYAGA
jgi:indolepyruvate ferredoxin oxidoreductase alpha subunit